MEVNYRNYRQKIEEVLRDYSGKNAVTYMRSNGTTEKLSFHDIEVFLHKASEDLEKYNIIPGDRVAIVSPLSPYAVIISIVLTYMNITIVPVDASLPVGEIEKLIEFSDVRGLFITDKLHSRISRKITGKIPCFRIYDALSITPFEDSAPCIAVKTPDPEMDVTAIIYSSGTTGQMKGVKITYKSVLNAVEINKRLVGIKAFMRYLLVLPFNHIAGFTSALAFFLTGCEIGFIEDVDASKLQKGMQEFKPHCFVIIPKVYEVMEQKIRAAVRAKGIVVYKAINALLKISGFLRKSFGINIGRKVFHSITKEVFGTDITSIGTGASPCKAETAEFFLNLGLKWHNFYASTETNVPVTATSIVDKYPSDTVGNVNHHPEIEVRINGADENGIGEIVVKSQLMMKGYFRAPELTKEAFENRFFKTGDYGYIDKKGFLHITGRIKESIVLQNGKKVSPADVDDYYLARVPGYDIASRGIVSPEGQYDETHLFIASDGLDQQERKKVLSLFERESRSAPSMYKLLGIHFVQQIQRTSVGKVKRFCLEPEDSQVCKAKTVEKQTEDVTASDTVYSCIRRLQELDSSFEMSGDMRIKEDIGMDSLNVFEMCVELDEKYGISAESCLHEGITVSEIISIIENGGGNSEDKDDTQGYPLERTKKDYRAFDRFIRLSEKIWRFEISGKENIRSDENYIFCPNHECHFDGMWVIGHLDERIRHNICSVAADYLFKSRIYSRGIISMGGIPVHRDGNTAPALKTCI